MAQLRLVHVQIHFLFNCRKKEIHMLLQKGTKGWYLASGSITGVYGCNMQ